MPKLHLLDRLITDAWPNLSTPEALRAFERQPYDERIAAQSTYEALQIGASYWVTLAEQQLPAATL